MSSCVLAVGSVEVESPTWPVAVAELHAAELVGVGVNRVA
jgi:hypothetical protein